jgi:hypothetical protein
MLFESLESRTLMSVSAIDTQVAADRLKIREDLITFQTDCLAKTAALLADCKALKADGIYKDAALKPLFQTLRGDMATLDGQLKVERLNESSAALKDEANILTDFANIDAAKLSKNKNAEKTARAQLLADRIQLQTDDLAGLNARLATRQSGFTTISNDMAAIVTAIGNDSGASGQLVADVNKFVTDKTAFYSKITADVNTLIADRTQLVTDLAAQQTAPAT